MQAHPRPSSPILPGGEIGTIRLPIEGEPRSKTVARASGARSRLTMNPRRVIGVYQASGLTLRIP